MSFEEKIMPAEAGKEEKYKKSEQESEDLSGEEKEKMVFTKEEIENYDMPGADEILKIMSEEVPEDEKEKMKQMIEKVPLNIKAELVKTFKEQVELFKDLGKGLKEKIKWDGKTTKAVVCLGLYGLLNVMGGALHANESDSDSDSNMDFGGELSLDSAKAILSNAFEQFITMEMHDMQKTELFLTHSDELFREMKDVGGKRIIYEFAINDMIKLVEHADKDNLPLIWLHEVLRQTSDKYLDYAIDDLKKSEVKVDPEDEKNLNNSDEFIESNQGIISEEIVLPEKYELEFNSHFTEVEKMHCQEYYDNKIEEIHAAAEQFEWWAEKYGHKKNFLEFEKMTKDYIKNLIDTVKRIEKDVNNPDFNGKAYVSGVGDCSRESAEIKLGNIDIETNLRTELERSNDAFNF